MTVYEHDWVPVPLLPGRRCRRCGLELMTRKKGRGGHNFKGYIFQEVWRYETEERWREDTPPSHCLETLP